MSEICTTKEFRYIEECLGKKLCRLFMKLDAFLAGGCLTSIFSNQPIHDFDIFFRDKESFDKAKRYFRVICLYNDYDTKEVCETDRASTFQRTTLRDIISKSNQDKYGPSYVMQYANEKTIVQLVDPDFAGGSPAEVFMNFDFTVCKSAYLFKNGEFIFDRTFLKDLSRRELIFCKETRNIVSSFFRAQKYKSRGFHMSTAEEMKMAMVIGSKKFATFGDFIRSSCSAMSDEVIQHLYNHIRHPGDKITRKEESLTSQPYNVDIIIDWLEELVHESPYVPRDANSIRCKKEASFDDLAKEDKMNEILDSDMSEETIKAIIVEKEVDFFAGLAKSV